MAQQRLTKQQEQENYGQFIHEFLYLNELSKVVTRIEVLEGRGVTPGAPTSTATTTKVEIKFKHVPKAKAYVIHYGPVGDSNPRDAIFMGYKEAGSAAVGDTIQWDLAKEDYPVGAKAGDTVYFWVQSFQKESTITGTDIEKAADLNNNGWGSEWSVPVAVVLK